MKLESITVENYRQFEKAELTFDEGITILAGANNSGKTSLINLIKNIFVDDELNQIGIKIDMYRQEYRFTPAFAFIQAV